ncbi:MAG TPA: hypothetical protein PKE25_12170 [Novosphingobium sp.]|nr:hypothetical protein [Novosphingobium sp.]
MSEPDPARNRFFILQAVRGAGVAMILIGLLILRGEIAWHPAIGWVLLANGLVDVFVIPVVLARRWRSPRA